MGQSEKKLEEMKEEAGDKPGTELPLESFGDNSIKKSGTEKHWQQRKKCYLERSEWRISGE
jgi:hypothetical protein